MKLSKPLTKNQASSTQRNRRGSITELPLAFYCFLLVIVFPLLDLLGVASGATIVYLSTNECATRAANQRRYSDSLNDMLQTATAFTQTGFSNFARMQPIGGYEGSGADLYIDVNNTKTDTTTSYGPDKPMTAAVDETINVYEARVNSNYQIGPLINLSFLPILGNCQGMGKPAIINFSASKQIEYPSGLATAAAKAGPPLVAFSQTASPNEGSSDGGVSGSGWNMPSIYSAIASAGETIVSETVVQVPANNPNPTSTTLSLGSGQKIWTDLRANGAWSTGSTTLFSANGITPANSYWNGSNVAPDPAANEAELLGQIGTNPWFAIGANYQNNSPTGESGVLQLIMDDNYYQPASTVWGSGYADNIGSQTVRVIITQ